MNIEPYKTEETVINENGERENVVILALCEQEALILKPNVLYRFVPIDGCKRCEELNRPIS